MRRAAAVRLFLRAALLTVVHLVLLTLSPEASRLSVLVVAVPLVVVAWWLPATLVDLWFEYVHEPRFGHQPLAFRRFAVGSTASAVPLLLVVAAGSTAAYQLMDRTRAWSVVLAGIAVLVVVGLAKIDVATRSLTSQVRPISGVQAERLAGLAEAAGKAGTTFATADAEVLPGLNAFSARPGGRAKIVVSSELLDADDDLLAHVVAHELAHLRHRHLSVTLVLSAVAVAVPILALGLLASWGQPFRMLGVAESADPRGLVVAVGLLALFAGALGLVLAWVGRAHERKADEVAFDLVGGLPVPVVRALHVTHRADLDPGLLSRLVSSHPTPAERLHRASLVTAKRIPSER